MIPDPEMPIFDRLLQSIAQQRWLRFGIRDRILRRFAPPDRGVSVRFQTSFFGLKYQGDRKSFIDWSIYHYGAYCVEELDLVRDVLNYKLGAVFLDIGANVGQHSLFASQFAREVHAFEPYSVVADQFESNLALNQIRNVQLHRVGLGSEDAALNYTPPATENLGTGSFSTVSSSTGVTTLSLMVRNGDSYLQEHGVSAVDFIKIDTEGFELEVLQGLSKTLQSSQPLVFFEWTPQKHGERSPHLLDYFPAGYVLKKFLPEQVVGLLFRRRSYALVEPNTLDEGNYLAGPAESLAKLK